jgi:hypothetical protein
MSGAEDDPRFNIGLLADVMTLLRNHGYVEAPRTAANVLVELRALVHEFEGKTAHD